MHAPNLFLESLALVLCVAAVTTVLFQRLHQPVVLGYILAGFLVGPHVPVPVIADHEIIETLSELGVIMLMFSLGLEFSLRKFVRVGFTAGVTALIQCSIQLWLGFVAARAFGWTVREAMFTGAALAISSTTIIAKAFDELGASRDLRSLVVAVLIVEDLIALIFMAGLTAIGGGESLSIVALAESSGRLLAFLGALVVLGMLIVPRGIRAISTLQRPETLLIASIGICFGMSYLAMRFGYSVALGAFLAGVLVAESGKQHSIEPLVEPVRDVFAAVFFVSVGMSINPHTIAEHWVPIVLLTAVVIVGKIIGVAIGAFLTGSGTRLALRAGMSLAQIGEFSFIIAVLGESLGATREFLYPTVAAVSAITTLTTPWMIRWSDPLASRIEGALPHSFLSFAALYTSWLERLRTPARRGQAEATTRRFARLLAIDTVLLAAVVIGAAEYARAAAHTIVESLGTSETVARYLVLTLIIAVSTPLCIGILNVVRHLATELAETALPEPSPASASNDRSELGTAARRTLGITLQLAALLLTGLPLVAVTQPFLSGTQGALLLALGIAVCVFAVYRRARNFQGEVRAGTQLIAAALQQSPEAESGRGLRPEVQRFLSELGEPESVQLKSECRAIGETLVSLDVRGSTGATVLAIAREPEGAIVPTGREVLRENDVLVLAGSHEALADARRLLSSPGRASVH